MEGEEWRDVVGFEDYYEVSDYGRVRTKERVIVYDDKQQHKHTYYSKVVRQYKNKRGYCVVNLCRKEYRHGLTKNVHKLVLEAFSVRPNGLDQINHKDEIKHNNCLYNLEYCDCRYNINYGTALSRAKETRKKNKTGFVPVLCYTTKGEFVAEYDSLDIAAKTLCDTSNHISEVCHHKSKTYYGYYWIQKGWDFEKWLSEHNRRFKDKEVKVRQYTLDFLFVAEYDSIQDAEIATGIRHISDCSKRILPRVIAGGYIWLRNGDTLQNWYNEAMPHLKEKHKYQYMRIKQFSNRIGL